MKTAAKTPLTMDLALTFIQIPPKQMSPSAPVPAAAGARDRDRDRARYIEVPDDIDIGNV